MQRCLQLASLGAGLVSPNPMVGAVLVHDGRIIGEGYHEVYGGPHAEVNCINSVQEDDRHLIRESTLYVSLEPCNHYGKTPPCTELILHHGIKRVVLASGDPFEKVNGTGTGRLRAAGVEVTEGVLDAEAKWLNRRFLCFHEKRRPYVILKWAMSADGKMAAEGNRPVRISDRLTDRLVHRWRAEEAAIMVGSQTAITDNPLLTTRLWPGRNPVRVLVDTKLRVPAGNHLLDQSVPTLVINTRKDGGEGNLRYVMVPEANMKPADFLPVLYQEDLLSVMVEGGATLLQSFLDAGLWDEARVIQNRQLVLPGGPTAPAIDQAAFFRQDISGTDTITIFRKAHANG